MDASDIATYPIHLGPGEYAIKEPGTWHTADVDAEATGVFIASGMATEHRPRWPKTGVEPGSCIATRFDPLLPGRGRERNGNDACASEMVGDAAP